MLYEVITLIFVVIRGNDVSTAEHKRRIAVRPGLFASQPFEPRRNRLERIQLEQRLLLPFAAGKGRKPAGILFHQGIEIVFDSLRGSALV